MSTTIIIPIISGILTLIASLWLTTLKSKSDLKKLKKIHEQNYDKALFDKRIEIYPKLYSLLSNYRKTILYNKHSFDNLYQLNSDINSWNNEYGIFLQNESVNISSSFRQYLDLLLLKSKKNDISDKQWQLVDNIIIKYELSLREEIGILDDNNICRPKYTGDINASLDKAIENLKNNQIS